MSINSFICLYNIGIMNFITRNTTTKNIANTNTDPSPLFTPFLFRYVTAGFRSHATTNPIKNGAATDSIFNIVFQILNLSNNTTAINIHDKITTTNNTLSIFLLNSMTLFKFSMSNSFFFLTLITN